MRSIRSKIGEIFVAYTYLTNKVQPQKILGTSVKLFCSTKTPRPRQRRNIFNFQKFVWRGSDIYHVFQQLLKTRTSSPIKIDFRGILNCCLARQKLYFDSNWKFFCDEILRDIPRL